MLVWTLLHLLATLSWPLFAVIGRVWWVVAALQVHNPAAPRYILRVCTILFVAVAASAPQFAQPQVTERDLVRVEKNQERLLGLIEQNQRADLARAERLLALELTYRNHDDSMRTSLAAVKAEVSGVKAAIGMEGSWLKFMVGLCTLFLGVLMKFGKILEFMKKHGVSMAAFVALFRHKTGG